MISGILIGIAAAALIIALLDVLGAWRDPPRSGGEGE